MFHIHRSGTYIMEYKKIIVITFVYAMLNQMDFWWRSKKEIRRHHHVDGDDEFLTV